MSLVAMSHDPIAANYYVAQNGDAGFSSALSLEYSGPTIADRVGIIGVSDSASEVRPF
jgi:hypothetical protein